MTDSEHNRINEEKWDKWAKSADGKGAMFDYLRKAQSALISIIDIPENLSFLDIGCGTGWAVGQVAKAAGNTGDFYGVDLSQGMIDKASINFNGNGNFHFIRANAESIPLDDNTFDIIICTNSFHHYLHPDKAMKEAFRLLKPGGKIYILDPTADTLLVRFIDKIIRFFEPQHVKLYSTGEFKNLIMNSGLKYSGSKEIAPREKVHMGQK
jgi:ubiquinone/menaquinone biosynthesis C-methylase UbiE